MIDAVPFFLLLFFFFLPVDEASSKETPCSVSERVADFRKTR